MCPHFGGACTIIVLGVYYYRELLTLLIFSAGKVIHGRCFSRLNSQPRPRARPSSLCTPVNLPASPTRMGSCSSCPPQWTWGYMLSTTAGCCSALSHYLWPMLSIITLEVGINASCLSLISLRDVNYNFGLALPKQQCDLKFPT